MYSRVEHNLELKLETKALQSRRQVRDKCYVESKIGRNQRFFRVDGSDDLNNELYVRLGFNHVINPKIMKLRKNFPILSMKLLD